MNDKLWCFLSNVSDNILSSSNVFFNLLAEIDVDKQKSNDL